MSDAANAIGYAGAVDAYRQASWIGVLPLTRGFKKWPPSIKCPDARAKPKRPCKPRCECISWTGHNGIDPSGADIAAWSEQYRDGNLCLRVPNNDQIAVVGIDVDHYGAKAGGATLAEAIRRWGPLPAAPRSTSRADDLVSGIRLFRVPPGTMLENRINFDELNLGDIEICQRHHRYVIAWPSIHPEGREYWWRNDAGQLIGIPAVDDLPWLPPRWIDGLRVTPKTQLNGHYDVSLTLTPGEPSLIVQQRLSQAIKELNLPGTSRHDTTLRHVMALMRMGKSGEPGVKKSLELLCEVFVAAVSVDGSRSPGEPREEFVRMITNDNAARELSQAGLNDWIRTLAIEESQRGPDIKPQVGLRQAEINGTEISSAPSEGIEGAETGATNADTEGDVTVQRSAPRSRLEEIEQGFWDSRESLRMIYQTSMAMMAPPWGTLSHCAARALTQVRPHVTLPALIGGPGSLNWFAIVVAPPAGGKGTAASTSKLLVPGHVIEWEVGSGEGMIAVYGRRPEDRVESIMFKAEEMDSVNAMNSRSGSTTLTILRSGFFGENVGAAYSDEKKCRRLEAGAYRMTLVISSQPDRAAWLLADAGGGTPQRFMWFPGSDNRYPEEEVWPSGPLALPHPTEWQYPREIVIPAEVRRTIRGNRRKIALSESDALDGHALFSREKFAFALAVLDGRVEMTIEDWELSGIAAEVSAYTRDLVIEEIERIAHEEASERGVLRGIEMAAAATMRAYEAQQQWPRVVRWVRDRLDAAGDQGVLARDLSRTAPKSIRQYLSTALAQLAADGLAANPEKTRWVRL